MREAIGLKPDPQQIQDSSVASIALETSTSADVVKALYEEQFAALSTQAKVKQYLGVIVSKRVKRQLRELGNR